QVRFGKVARQMRRWVAMIIAGFALAAAPALPTDVVSFLNDGYGDLMALLGREGLEGNGIIGFQTPIASPHAFQGWAEVFVMKPPDGLTDLYAKATYGFSVLPLIGKIIASVAYHDFAAERTDVDLGNEWDGSLEGRLNEHFIYGTALALYEGGSTRPS